MTEDRPIWGIHMDWVHEDRPITGGFVAIGWPAVGNLSKLPADREAFKKAVAAGYPTTKPGAVPVVGGTLYRFANEMKAGDLVVYPSKPDRLINIGVLTGGGYIYDPTSDLDFPNRRQVKWSRHIARAEFSQDA